MRGTETFPLLAPAQARRAALRPGAALVPLPDLPSIPSPPLIVEDDSGRFRLGLHDDDSPGFESRAFAEGVRAKAIRVEKARIF